LTSRRSQGIRNGADVPVEAHDGYGGGLDFDRGGAPVFAEKGKVPSLHCAKLLTFNRDLHVSAGTEASELATPPNRRHAQIGL
jgi:hypothetical protein